MNKHVVMIRNAGLLAGALLLAPLALAAEEAATNAAAAPTAEAAAPAVEAAAPAAVNTDAAAPAAPEGAVSLTASGDHVVVVHTGNEAMDAAGNYAAKCTEKVAAMKSCDMMGSFKAMACRKLAEVRYKGADCPNL